MKKDKKDKRVEIKNKKALHDFFMVEFYTSGIKLLGTEIKSIRNYDANFSDSYCVFEGKHLILKNFHISEYKYGTYNNHEPLRDRILLLRKKELRKMRKSIEEKGMTIIPIKLFINDRGLAKMEIALSKGKKQHDKKQSLKEKDLQRELERFR